MKGSNMAVDLAVEARERGIKYFLISYVDLFGTLRAKLAPASRIGDMAREGGGWLARRRPLDERQAGRARSPQHPEEDGRQGRANRLYDEDRRRVRVLPAVPGWLGDQRRGRYRSQALLRPDRADAPLRCDQRDLRLDARARLAALPDSPP